MRRILPILVSAILALATAGLFTVITPPVYESHAKLLVRWVVDGGDSSTPAYAKKVIGTETELLTSVHLASEVAKAVGYQRLAPKSESPAAQPSDALKTLQSGFGLTAREGTGILALSFRSHDPDLPPLVLNEFVRQYLELHLGTSMQSPAANWNPGAAPNDDHTPKISLIEKPAAARRLPPSRTFAELFR